MIMLAEAPQHGCRKWGSADRLHAQRRRRGMRKQAICSNSTEGDWFSPAIFCAAILYLDPGTGSLIIQAVIAAVLSILYFTKQFWMKTFSRISRRILRRRDGDDDEPGSP
jgi:hypothetical protein